MSLFTVTREFVYSDKKFQQQTAGGNIQIYFILAVAKASTVY